VYDTIKQIRETKRISEEANGRSSGSVNLACQ